MKDEFKGITPEKFKKYKKGQLGSWQKFNTKTDAGNVELNTAIFNNASTPQASPNTSPVGGGMGESLETDEYGQYNKLINGFKKTDDRELCKTLDTTTSIPYGPSFVLPDGTIVYSEEGEYAGSEVIHEELIEEMLRVAADKLDISLSKIMLDYAWSDVINSIFDNIMDDRGWVRLNTGTSDVDDRYYMVLPKRRPTNAQFSVVEDFINEGYDDGQPEILVYIEDNAQRPTSKVYSYDEYLPEDILKNIKRYYASGVLYETVEPQEQLFTDEDVKYLTEWIIDVIDLNIKKTETELGDGRYVVYTERERDGGHSFEVVDELNHEYIGSATTFGKVEPVVCVMERVANSIAKNIITMIQKYDNSLIGDSTIRQIKEKCMKSIDKGIDDVLILEQVGGYDAIACEFDKKKNSLRVYSIENPTIDLYRGNLK